MKKYCIATMLVVISMSGNLSAQTNGWTYYNGKTKTEQLFDVTNTRWLRHSFTIILKNSNSVIVKIPNKQAFETIIDLEALLNTVANNLLPFKDSLSNELTHKRIDYVTDLTGKTKIRLVEHKPAGNSFVLLKDGPAPMKIEQDTLNIIGYITLPKAERIDTRGIYNQLPYKITVLINNIQNLATLADGSLNSFMQQTKKEWDALKRWRPENNWKTNLYVYNNTNDPKFNRALKEPYISDKVILTPYFQIGLQNVNSLLTTSTGAGLEIQNKINTQRVLRYQLFWEPYFFFDKNNEGKFRLRRNDFITFQFISAEKRFVNTTAGGIEFNQNLSFGYLILRSGGYFQETTFKVGLPGAAMKFVTLHPEFIFNKFFKNFQPGLKLFLDLD